MELVSVLCYFNGVNQNLIYVAINNLAFIFIVCQFVSAAKRLKPYQRLTISVLVVTAWKCCNRLVLFCELFHLLRFVHLRFNLESAGTDWVYFDNAYLNLVSGICKSCS